MPGERDLTTRGKKHAPACCPWSMCISHAVLVSAFAPSQLVRCSAEQALAPHLGLEGMCVVVSPLVFLHVQLRCRVLLLPPGCIRFHVGWQLIGVCQLCPAWDDEVVSPVANRVVLPAWSGKMKAARGLRSCCVISF